MLLIIMIIIIIIIGMYFSIATAASPSSAMTKWLQPTTTQKKRDILYMLVNSSTFASQAKISIFASQMTRISNKKCTRFD
jgi:hypothetical protein